AMIFIAPHNSDWNYIANETSDRSWKAKRMRKYFARIERCLYLRRPWWQGFNWDRHGYDGWLPTTIADPSLLMRDPVLLRLVVAAIQTCFADQVWYSQTIRRRIKALIENFSDPTGFRRVGVLHRTFRWLVSLMDANDWRRLRDGGEGPTLVPLTVSKGVRAGTREPICDTARRLPANLAVKLNALATRVLLDNDNRATGVESSIRRIFTGRIRPRRWPVPSRRRGGRSVRGAKSSWRVEPSTHRNCSCCPASGRSTNLRSTTSTLRCLYPASAGIFRIELKSALFTR